MSHVLVLVGSANEGLNTALADAATTVLSGLGHTVLLVTPEYNGGPSSLIKPAAVFGASPSSGGTAGAREALQEGLRRSGAAIRSLAGIGE